MTASGADHGSDETPNPATPDEPSAGTHGAPDELGWVSCTDPQAEAAHPDNCVHHSHDGSAAVLAGVPYTRWRAERDLRKQRDQARRLADATAVLAGHFGLSAQQVHDALTHTAS